MRTSERRNLKTDRFAETAAETYSWAAEHRNKLIVGAAIIAAILVVVIGLWQWNQSRNDKANVALGEAMSVYSAPIGPSPDPSIASYPTVADRAKAAHAKFEAVASQYGHTAAGKSARYMAAVTALDMGDNATAERELKDVSDSGDKDLAALAKMALASLYRNTNREQQAIDLYKQLINSPTQTVDKAAAQLALASVYETKQPAEAAKLYEDIQKNSPKTAAAQIAQQRLATAAK